LHRFLCQIERFDPIDRVRYMVGVPGTGGVAPWAMYWATVQTDEKSGFPQVGTFALPGMKVFVNRQCPADAVWSGW